MSVAYFHCHEYSINKSIRESRNRFFSNSGIQVSRQGSTDARGEEPVNDCKKLLQSTKLLQNTSK